MTSPLRILRDHKKLFIVCFVYFNAVVLLNSVQMYAHALRVATRPHSVDLIHFPNALTYVRWNFGVWYTRAVLSPLVIVFALRYPIRPRAVLQGTLLYMFWGCLVAVLTTLLQSTVFDLFSRFSWVPYGASLDQMSQDASGLTGWSTARLVQRWSSVVFMYWTLMGLVQAWHYYSDSRRQEIHSTQLQAQLARLQLDVLRSQLNPHFLFNTLNAISTLVHEDPFAAEDMIINLSRLLRAFLEESADEISLRKELALLELYLEIERIRFGNRLVAEVTAEPEVLDCAVPSLILQPLVENAIRHGIGRHAGTDTIRVDCFRVEKQIRLQIVNWSSHLEHSPEESLRRGIGLSNTKSRLKALYETDFTIDISNMEPRGVAVRISFPRSVVRVNLEDMHEVLD